MNKKEIKKLTNEELRTMIVTYLDKTEEIEPVLWNNLISELEERVYKLKEHIIHEEYNLDVRGWNKEDRYYIAEQYNELAALENLLDEV